MRVTSADWADLVLRYDPDSGDKDDGGVRVLRRRIVRARKVGPCSFCADAVIPGSRVLAETAVVDDIVKTIRTCYACCDAMAKSWSDDGAALDARFAARETRV